MSASGGRGLERAGARMRYPRRPDGLPDEAPAEGVSSVAECCKSGSNWLAEPKNDCMLASRTDCMSATETA